MRSETARLPQPARLPRLAWIIGVVVIRGRREPRFHEIVELAGLRAPWRGCAIGCVAGRSRHRTAPKSSWTPGLGPSVISISGH